MRLLWLLITIAPYLFAIQCSASPTSNDEWGWTKTNFPETLCSVQMTSWNSTIYVCAIDESETSYVYKTADQGETWESAAIFTETKNLNSIVSNTSGDLYITAYDQSSQTAEILLSTDEAETWMPLANQPPFSSEENGVFNRLYIDHNDYLYVIGMFQTSNYLIYISRNHGDTWTPLGEFQDVTNSLRNLKLDPSGNFLAATDNRIFESNDFGENWRQSLWSPHRITALEVVSGDIYLAGFQFNNTIKIKYPASDEWINAATIDSAESIKSFFCFTNNRLFVGTATSLENESSIYQSEDLGLTCTPMYMNVWEHLIRQFIYSSNGYFYAAGLRSVFRSEASLVSPTPTHTTGPGTPTNTPYPSTATPTPRPSRSPTPTPTPAPPTQAPEPTIPCFSFGLSLEHPETSIFVAGDPFYLNIEICNNFTHPVTDVHVVIMLEIQENFFFAPSWSKTLDCYHQSLPTGISTYEVLPEMEWPETDVKHYGVILWGALIDRSFTKVIGEYDMWMFGWN